MRRISLLAVALGLLPPACLLTSASAQNAVRLYVSGSGSDANVCSISSPCQTFSGALIKAGRENIVKIVCRDTPAATGFLAVDRTLHIECGGIGAQVNSIDVNAGANDVVRLRGLDINSLGEFTGITFNSGAALIIEDSTIGDFGSLGINFQPSGVATLTIVNSSIVNNGDATSGGGLRVATRGSGFARASLKNVVIDKNYVGIAAVGSGANASIEIADSTISHSRSIGVVAVGSGAVVRLRNSSIVGNAGAATSGNVLSFQNNQIAGNNPDTFPASAALR